MIELLAQTAPPPPSNLDTWTPATVIYLILIALPAITALVIAWRSNAKANVNQQATQNLATATKDVATTKAGGPQPNLDPHASTLKMIDNIARGGTGAGGAAPINFDKPR